MKNVKDEKIFREKFLKRSLKNIKKEIEQGLAPASIKRTYDKIMSIASKWNCEPWRLNGVFLRLSKRLGTAIKEPDTVWFPETLVYDILDEFGIEREVVHDILPFFKEFE